MGDSVALLVAVCQAAIQVVILVCLCLDNLNFIGAPILLLLEVQVLHVPDVGGRLGPGTSVDAARITVQREAAQTQTIATKQLSRVALKAGGKLRIGKEKIVGLTQNRRKKLVYNI